MRRSTMVGIAIAMAAATPMAHGAAASAAAPAFIPIHHEWLALPAGVQPYAPNWMPDGRHILFQNEVDGRTWIVAADGSDARCVTCRFADDPGPGLPGGLFFVYSFPDQKRLLLTAGVDVTYSTPAGTVAYGMEWLGANSGTGSPPPGQPEVAVVECAPSIVDCASHRVVPVDLSADANPSEPVGQRRTWHLSPDGKHLMWMDVRPDGTVMIVARLEREADRYAAVDPRIVNPPAPTGAGDADVEHWAYVGQTLEGKSFAAGGRQVEYIGGPDAGNFDVATVDLQTGARHRLTTGPDWDEDGAVSPDGAYLVTASWRTMHRIDVLGGMLPEIHSFIDLPFMSAVVGNYVSTHEGFQCDLTPWLLGSSGDGGGRLLGQPIAPYDGGSSYAANNLVGAPMWSPDGTRVLLQEKLYGPSEGTTYLQSVLGSVPSRLMIAKLDRPPGAAIPVTSSKVGDWAPSAHSAGTGFDRPASVTVPGKVAGTVSITFAGNILSSAGTVTYRHYSDDGQTFADGTQTITNPQILVSPVTLDVDITISGAHSGFWRGHMDAGGGKPPSGAIESAFDGHHVSGLPAVGACPQSLPRATPLRVQTWLVRRGDGDVIDIRVRASIHGAGRSEQLTDTRPVHGATVSLAGQHARTDARGRATLPLPPDHGRHRLEVTAGDTFVPASKQVVA
jgi:Tol biopolymer transport system component